MALIEDDIELIDRRLREFLKDNPLEDDPYDLGSEYNLIYVDSTSCIDPRYLIESMSLLPTFHSRYFWERENNER